jgi:hypothetical protein
MSDSEKKVIDELGENIMDIMKSVEAIKGENFANAVAHHFEALQLGEALGSIRGMIFKSGAFDDVDPDATETISNLIEISVQILISMSAKMMDSLSEDDCQEVMNLCKKLQERRQMTMESMNRG